LLRIWQEDRKTVLFITHSISEALFLSDRVAVMSPRPGRIVGVFDVPSPRPRSLDVLTDPRMHALSQKLRALMGTQFAE
jgi:NitT/TauT family transport system ATP-binding protein